MRRARSIGRAQPGTGGRRSARIPAESRPAPPGSSRHEPPRYAGTGGRDRRGIRSFLSAPRPSWLRAVSSLRRTRRFRAAASRLPVPFVPFVPFLPGHNAAAPRPLPAGGAVRFVGRAVHCAAGARPSWRRAESLGGPRAVRAARLPAERRRCGAAGGAERTRSGAASGHGSSVGSDVCGSREGR